MIQGENERAVETVESAQASDGYIGTPFQLDHAGKRWKALAARRITPVSERQLGRWLAVG